MSVNFGAIETLIESQLFGYGKGAFTDARQDHPGFFQEANGGVLFCDEIAELPLPLQPKLLRALQNKKIRPVNGLQDVPIDVKILSATNADLEQAVKEERFRKDLYTRLSGATIRLPSLRERREDIPLLAQHFAVLHRRTLDALDWEEVTSLCAYSWPGNIRELEDKFQEPPESSGRKEKLPPPPNPWRTTMSNLNQSPIREAEETNPGFYPPSDPPARAGAKAPAVRANAASAELEPNPRPQRSADAPDSTSKLSIVDYKLLSALLARLKEVAPTGGYFTTQEVVDALRQTASGPSPEWRPLLEKCPLQSIGKILKRLCDIPINRDQLANKQDGHTKAQRWFIQQVGKR